MNLPKYTIDKIKFATDRPTFEKAVVLYEKGKVTKIIESMNGYSAVVIGTNPYGVFVESKQYDYGTCTCYLGQQGILCKHMVALALYAVMDGKSLSKEDMTLIHHPVFSGMVQTIANKDLLEAKNVITQAMRYIKPYTGPSRTWFVNQNLLQEGCNRLSATIARLPACEQTAKLIIDMLLRLDKKLCIGGVDDSNGIVGGFITEAVDILLVYAKSDPSCIRTFQTLKNRKTCFGWEDPLIHAINI